jgi:hypothetical protein
MQDLWQLQKENNSWSGLRPSWIATTIAAFSVIVGLVTAFLQSSGWIGWLSLLVAVLSFGFIVAGNWFLTRQLGKSLWTIAASVIAIIILFSSLFCGTLLNLLLAPLLIETARLYRETRLILNLSLGLVALLGLEQIVFLGLNYRVEPLNPAVVILALGAVGYSMEGFIRGFRGELKLYQEDAAIKASEMEVAHEIQTSLMAPTEIVTGNWSMAARSLPARDVGGDFYEYVPYMEKIGGIAIGDVAGKGIPAALQMAVVRTVFRIEARRRIFPGETLMSVNAALQAERSFGMVTMLYAFVDPSTNTLHVANAGHNFPIILNGKMEEVRLPGLPLGIDDSIEYENLEIKIAPGTNIIFYTDGVVEAMNTTGEMWGFDNFRETICRYQQLKPQEMIDNIFHEISIFTQGAAQSDDITILILQHQCVGSNIEANDPEVNSMFATVTAYGGNEDDKTLEGFKEDNINWI